MVQLQLARLHTEAENGRARNYFFNAVFLRKQALLSQDDKIIIENSKIGVWFIWPDFSLQDHCHDHRLYIKIYTVYGHDCRGGSITEQ